MFEKEAEEYAEKHAFRIPYDGSDKFYDDKDYECSKEGFQKGAEFGYNKANEWHYVKDGDLPKEEKDMFLSKHLILLTKMKGADNLFVNLGQYNFSTQEFSYQHIVGLTDVIAWKEIVLPELKEKEQ